MPNQTVSSESIDMKDRMAKVAGILLLATAVLTIIMVYARVSADADRATVIQSLQAIATNRGMFGLSGTARLLSGLTLIGAGLVLLRTWIFRERQAMPIVPYALVLSGAFTAVSGACALLIAVSPDLNTFAAGTTSMPGEDTALSAMYSVRWIAGKIGFTLAGVSVLVAARDQWRAGGMLRKLAPGSAILGVAMQFIWLDSATILHPVVGAAFFVWLLIAGILLATGSVERQFRAVDRGTA